MAGFIIEDAPQPSGGKFVIEPAPPKMGKDAQDDFLRAELANADWGTRQIAGFGTALSNVWEGAKQFIGQGDAERIQANKVIEEAAPVGSIAGNVAMTAIPFGMAGNSINAAAKVGLGLGALKPVEGEQTLANIAREKIKSAAIGGVAGAAGQAIANKSGEIVSKKLQDLALRKAQNAPIDKTLADALDAGLTVTPTAANPSLANQIKESIGGKLATAQEASNRNAPVIDKLARKAVGLADDAPLTSEAMQQVRRQAYDVGYAPVAQLGTIKTDTTFVKALDSLVAKHQGASASFPGAFKDDVSNAVQALKVGEFDSGNALKATQLLRDEAQAAFRAGDTGLSQAKKGAAKAIEDQIERSLGAAGKNGAELLKNYRAARTLMAKAHTVEDAIVEGGGSINASKLAARVQAGKKLTDELAIIGNFANNFKESVKPAAMVQGPGVSKLNSALSFVTGIAGAGAGGPVGAAGGAALPFILPPLARKAILSRGSQNALRNAYRLGLPTRAANSLLQYAPVGGTVLGLDTLTK